RRVFITGLPQEGKTVGPQGREPALTGHNHPLRGDDLRWLPSVQDGGSGTRRRTGPEHRLRAGSRAGSSTPIDPDRTCPCSTRAESGSEETTATPIRRRKGAPRSAIRGTPKNR